jgi:hypothetical protein
MRNIHKPPIYVAKREAGQCVFVPSLLFVRMMVGGFGAGSAYLVYLSTLFFRRAGASFGNLWFGAIFLLAAVLVVCLGIRAWRTRRTPLTIERGGRVSFGEREICAPRTVQAVRIARAPGGDANHS